MPRRTAEEASRTRAAIVDQALAVFAERGVAAAQLDEVARRAGVTRGALYHHFAGKEELLVAVLSERWRSATEPLLAPLRAAPGAAALRDFVRRFLEASDRDPTVRALLKLSTSGELSAIADPGLAEKASAFAEWLDLIEPCVAAARGSGRGARVAAETLLQALLGYALWSSMSGPARPASYQERTDLILAGLSPRRRP